MNIFNEYNYKKKYFLFTLIISIRRLNISYIGKFDIYKP